MPMFVFDSDGSLLPYFEACDSADVPTIFPPPNGEKVQYCMCPAATARLRKKLRHFWVVVSGEYENPHERALRGVGNLPEEHKAVAPCGVVMNARRG